MKKENSNDLGLCSSSTDLSNHTLLNEEQAVSLENTFKILANSSRLRILHALVIEKEMCVSDLARLLNLNTTAVSNQLQRLTERGIVASRREGLKVIYRILDPCAISVMNYAWCLTQCAECRKDQQDCLKRIP
ncbi:MAG TPA: ArsR family transcriptional regulator [Desulfobacterales bacterium]|nr:ArsR family transcriptional regulator [Desulfobacterales bacterium]